MGMYDEIRCEYPLPESGYRVLPGHTFQTRSFWRGMDRYTITTERILILHHEVWEKVPQAEREWDDLLGEWVEPMRAVPAGNERIPYHGDVYFDDSFAIRDEAGQVYIKYKARFTEGRLSRIEVEEVRDLALTKTIELGGQEYQAAESGLGFDVIEFGAKAEVERDTNE